MTRLSVPASSVVASATVNCNNPSRSSRGNGKSVVATSANGRMLGPNLDTSRETSGGLPGAAVVLIDSPYRLESHIRRQHILLDRVHEEAQKRHRNSQLQPNATQR